MKFVIAFCMVAAYAMAESTESMEKMLDSAIEQFTAKMFNEVVANSDKSVVLSAFSVLSPLAQLAHVAVGDSHDEIIRSTGMMEGEMSDGVFPSLKAKIKATKGVELKMASRLYIPQNYEVNDQFAALSTRIFDSDVRNIDFVKKEVAAAEINDWVESQTNHRIKNLVDPSGLGQNTKALLVNALYFKGKWAKPFDKKTTVDRDFHVNKAVTVKLPTMHQKSSFNYGESTELNAKLLEMPYEGHESSFLIILPNEIDGLPELEKKIKDPAVLNRAVQDMSSYEVDVYLPKFKIETTTNLKDVLQNMGINKLFDPKLARLENLIKGETDLFISDAIQKAFIEVNEEGAEAAAANAFIFLGSSAPQYTKTFKADRPFYFELKTAKTTLFNGQLRE